MANTVLLTNAFQKAILNYCSKAPTSGWG
jgi:hypothetical protein